MAILCSQEIFASNNLFPLSARVLGDVSTGSSTLADADALLPIYGSNTNILFLDASAAAGTDNSWLGSGGLGARRVVGENWLWGAYAFGDRNSDGYGGNFWVLNPGIEVMTSHWDAHINGYFPTTHKQKTRDLGQSHVLGVDDFVTFHGHSEFDTVLGLYRVVGNGLDGEIGLSKPFKGNRARLFLGGYYYSLQQGINAHLLKNKAHLSSKQPVPNFYGPQLGIEIPSTPKLSFILTATHDQLYGNQGRITIRYKLGEIIQKQTNDVAQRILDPIIRHEGTLGTASGIVSQQRIKNNGIPQLVSDHIWFFSPASSSNFNGINSCTFENPCTNTAFNQATVTGIESLVPKADYYFAPGAYSANNATQEIQLRQGESLYGRSTNYQSANLNNTFSGGFELLGTNKNYTIDHLNIQNDLAVDSQSARTAVTLAEENQLTINNSVLAVSSDGLSTTLAGIHNSGITTVHSSFIEASGSNGGYGQLITGIISDNGVATIDTTRLQVNSLNQLGNTQATVHGIHNVGSSVYLIDSNLQLNGSNSSPTQASVAGFFSVQGSANMINSHIIMTGMNEDSFIGLALIDGTASLQRSTIYGNVNDSFGDVRAGIYVAGGALTINESQITIAGNVSAPLIGIQAVTDHTPIYITLNDSIVTVNSGSNIGYLAAIYAISSPTYSLDMHINNSTLNVLGSALNGESGAVSNGSGTSFQFADNSNINLSNGSDYGVTMLGGIIANDGTTRCNGREANCNF